MGDGPEAPRRKNRVVRITSPGRNIVLEWKPRLITILLVVVLVALLLGAIDVSIVDNWEW
jgi:hypothetical protein